MLHLRTTTLLATVALLAGCANTPLGATDDEVGGMPVACARPAMPSVMVEVRDAAGRPAAIGATVVVRNRAGYEASAKGFGDSLRVAAGDNEGGTFDVVVTRPWHTSALVRDVRTQTDACGLKEPGRASVTLALLPGAPAVRQVVTAPWGYGFGWGNMRDSLPAQVVAGPGVSQEVVWAARDTSVIRLAPDGTLITQCRTVTGSTWAVVASAVDPARRDSTHVTVWPDQDPTRCP